MKIVVIQPRASYYLGGTEKECLIYTEFLLEFGNEIILYTTEPSGEYEYSIIYKKFLEKNRENINFHILVAKQFWRPIKDFKKRWKKLHQKLTEKKL